MAAARKHSAASLVDLGDIRSPGAMSVESRAAATARPTELTDEDRMLTRREAADYLRRHPSRLEAWAAAGQGPAFYRVGGRILYPLAGLRSFVRGEAVSS